ncbi:MAG: hypothetical protein ACKVQW_13360 [Pyrinomonadaceae bacterium]
MFGDGFEFHEFCNYNRLKFMSIIPKLSFSLNARAEVPTRRHRDD